MRWIRQVTCSVVLVLSAATAGWAQDAVIGGKVADPSGAALPGVDVTLASPALLGGRAVVSDDQGNYRFSLLPPGTYQVRFSLQGFGTVVQSGRTPKPCPFGERARLYRF